MDFPLLSDEKLSSSSKSVYLEHNPEGVPLLLLLLFNTTSIISLSLSYEYYSSGSPQWELIKGLIQVIICYELTLGDQNK
jgi:hypothetical protein